MKRTRNIVLLFTAAAILIVGALITYQFVLPALFTNVEVTGVPTARSSNLDALKTAQFQTKQAQTSTPRTENSGADNGGIFNVDYVSGSTSTQLPQSSDALYESCTTYRDAEAVDASVITPTPAPSATPTSAPEVTPNPDSNFVFLKVVPEESEACFVVAEILYNQRVYAVGVTQTISGEVGIDLNNASNSQIGEELNVNLAELKSDQDRRDRFIISRQGFNFNQFPFAKFTEAKAIGLPARAYVEGEKLDFQITGKLLIIQTTKDVTFNATGVYKGGTLVVTAYLDAKLTDFDFNPPNVGFARADDPFRIVLNLVFRAE